MPANHVAFGASSFSEENPPTRALVSRNKDLSCRGAEGSNKGYQLTNLQVRQVKCSHGRTRHPFANRLKHFLVRAASHNKPPGEIQAATTASPINPMAHRATFRKKLAPCFYEHGAIGLRPRRLFRLSLQEAKCSKLATG